MITAQVGVLAALLVSALAAAVWVDTVAAVRPARKHGIDRAA